MSNEKNLILSIYLCIDHWKRAGKRTIGGPAGGRAESLSCPRRKRSSERLGRIIHGIKPYNGTYGQS